MYVVYLITDLLGVFAWCYVVQLLDCYLEAYHHVFDRDERRSLSQVITNIMYRRPRFDFSADYFVRCYQLECYCLRLQAELVEAILSSQVNNVNNHNHSLCESLMFSVLCQFYIFICSWKEFYQSFCLSDSLFIALWLLVERHPVVKSGSHLIMHRTNGLYRTPNPSLSPLAR